MGFIIIAVLVVILLLLWATIDIVPQAEARVIERLGVFHAVWGAGLHVKIPIIDRAVVPHIDLREQVMELPRYENKGAANSVSFHAAGHDDGFDRDIKNTSAVVGVGATTGKTSFGALLGAIFGRAFDSRYETKYESSEFATLHKNRTDYTDFHSVITKDNVVMDIDAAVFYQVTDPKQYAYGMKKPLAAMQKLTITTLRNIIGEMELDETLCSRDVINSKLRKVLDEATDSWGVKITRVEIEDIVPNAEIQKAMHEQAVAERVRRATILKAEGEAEANRLLNETAPNEAVLRMLAIQTMPEVAKGQSNTVIIPSEIQGVVGLAKGVVEAVKQ